MNTTQRILGAAATALVAVVGPAASGAAAQEEWPPPSTHGRFVPVPADAAAAQTSAVCEDEVTLGAGDVNELESRVLVTEEGETVIETRGRVTADITRASDGATLDEFGAFVHVFETYSADGTTVTFDSRGTGIVLPFDDVEAAAFAEAGLPEAFVFLDGTFEETVTFGSPIGESEEIPPVVSAEITENTAQYVFDLCDLLDQAAAGQQSS
jgi:hypothetical protein